MNVIAESPTQEMYATGLEIDCQCARCGSSTDFLDCGNCDDGYVSRFEEDPLWYDENELYPCPDCNGKGGHQHCVSGDDWCETHPLPGREKVPRGSIEWFTIESTG
jgi:hypothetical protein